MNLNPERQHESDKTHYADPDTLATLNRLERENADLRAKLEEFLDLCPRMNEDDPIAPALAEACRNARAAIAQGKGEK